MSLKKFARRLLPAFVVSAARRRLGASRSRRFADPDSAQQAVGQVTPDWRRRIDLVVSCADNSFIPRVADAGRLRDGWITMHNGIDVSALGYYGEGVLNMLIENRGVHEPQEERAFAKVLPHVAPGSAMLELGAYWGFYSLWFAKEIGNARCYLVEPSFTAIESGRLNFAHAGKPGVFERAFVGKATGTDPDDGTPIITVDDFCERHAIDRLAILHADIQHAEADMLLGASRMLGGRLVDHVFISTHTVPLHDRCVQLLEGHGYAILASANPRQSFSIDGLIVARSPEIQEPADIEISLRT